jgi:hypothetical protein
VFGRQISIDALIISRAGVRRSCLAEVSFKAPASSLALVFGRWRPARAGELLP